jgi:hypothetical protein
MKILTLLEGSLEDLTLKQQKALGYVIEAFKGEIKCNIDIEQVLNCEFCMDIKEE